MVTGLPSPRKLITKLFYQNVEEALKSYQVNKSAAN